MKDTIMKSMTCAALTISVLLSAPAFAQDAPQSGDEKINTVILYGEDKCPVSTGDEITVCARLPEGDRYRIPKGLRSDINNPRRDAWAKRVTAYEYVAASGAMSCSASGGTGFTGCGLKEIDQAYAEKAADPGLAFGRMIAAERKKRMAGIDAEAELVEERVKQFEKERAEREARLAEEEDKALNAESGALPQPE
jgi:hypothetical protein